MSEAKYTSEELATHFAYLDVLRESGVTNMFGATPYLVRDQGLDEREAQTVLKMWMRSFRDHSPLERARAAIAKAEGR